VGIIAGKGNEEDVEEEAKDFHPPPLFFLILSIFTFFLWESVICICASSLWELSFIFECDDC